MKKVGAMAKIGHTLKILLDMDKIYIKGSFKPNSGLIPGILHLGSPWNY